MRLYLHGGSYQARAEIANAQRCLNLYPESNPKDSPVPLTHYQRAGLRPLVSGPNLPVRGLYRASNGQAYGVIGRNVYRITAPAGVWTLTQLGQITAGLTTPVSFIDNGTTILLVDGSVNGWFITLATDAFTQVVDPTGTFVGGDRVDVIDTFMLCNIPGTNRWISTLSNVTTFDPLYFGAKANYPDSLVGLIVNRHEILLIGQLKSEIWFDAGNPGFPFAELPGASIEHGSCAKYSLAAADVSIFWLGLDLQGQGVVFRQRAYETRRISTHALEYAIQRYDVISDAIGYTYQQYGHVYYVLQFPSAGKTWVFDEATEFWHEEATLDSNGNLGRHRGNCCAFINGLNVVGDFANGTLYHMDPEVYTDTVGGVTYPLRWIRTFPHLVVPPTETSPGIDGFSRLIFNRFVADVEVGTVGKSADGKPPQISMRYSSNRGKTFTPAPMQSVGATGEYQTLPTWQPLGMARDMVFELSCSIAGPCALNGAWVQVAFAQDGTA